MSSFIVADQIDVLSLPASRTTEISGSSGGDRDRRDRAGESLHTPSSPVCLSSGASGGFVDREARRMGLTGTGLQMALELPRGAVLSRQTPPAYHGRTGQVTKLGRRVLQQLERDRREHQ